MQNKPFWRIAIEKALSARFLVTIGLTFTFCLISYKTVMLFFDNIGNKEAIGTIEKIAMFILGSFCTQFANVVTSYFGRSDRMILSEENGNGGK
jgi:hypothetical protein